MIVEKRRRIERKNAEGDTQPRACNAMRNWMLLMEEVVALSGLFLLGIMYLFYVKDPYNKETDRRPEH